MMLTLSCGWCMGGGGGGCKVNSMLSLFENILVRSLSLGNKQYYYYYYYNSMLNPTYALLSGS